MRYASAGLALAVGAANALAVPLHESLKKTVYVQGYVFVDGADTYTTYVTLPSGSTVLQSGESLASAKPTAVTPTGASASGAATAASVRAPRLAAEKPVVLPSAPAAVTTATAAAGEAAPNLSPEASQLLKAHNDKRALHKDTPPLEWSNELANYAQGFVDSYDCSGNMVHTNGQYGENIAVGLSIPGAIDFWYNEGAGYDYSSNAFSAQLGHFTQLVWKSSTKVGCAVKQCNNEWGTYILCEYSQAGNVNGRFQENVMPLA